MAQPAGKTKKLKSTSRRISQVEYMYARMMCSRSDRLRIYQKLAALLRNRFSLVDALDRIYNSISNDGKNPGEPLAIAVSSWAQAIQNGKPFSEALRGWAPSNERLMLAVGDVAHMEIALENLNKVVIGLKRMTTPIQEAIAYPLFLMVLVLIIIWAIGAYMVPPMMEAAPNAQWQGIALSLANLADFVQDSWWVLIVAPAILLAIVIFSVFFWSGGLRSYVDGLPPWSLHRIFNGVGWLLSMAALVKSGTPVSKALDSLRSNASPYIRYRVGKTLTFVNNGDNLGDALHKTKLGFPDKEIIGDLRIYSEMDNFAEALDTLANAWLEESETSIATKAALLNTVAILGVAAVIFWAVLGTFEMQNQLTKFMGM